MTTTPPSRKAYPTDVTDAEWALVAPYLTLLDEAAVQRRYPLREVFNALRWMVRAGAPWRLLPTNFPPWPTVYQQARRWVAAGCFEALVHDRRLLLRRGQGRSGPPSAAIFDARVLQSSPESGARAGYDGHKRRKGSKIQQAVDTLGNLLALPVSPASADERTQVAALAAKVQAVTGEHVELAWVDQGYTGAAAAEAAADHGIQLEVVRLPEAKRGFVLLPRRWVAARSFAWEARFRRLARDDERLPTVLAGLHFIAFVCLLLHQVIPLISSS
jgi:transposase